MKLKWWSGRPTKIMMSCILISYCQQGVAIHCPTRTQAKRFFKDLLKVRNASGALIVHWESGKSVDPNQTQWDTYADKTVYIMRKWNEIGLGSLDKITCGHISYDKIIG